MSRQVPETLVTLPEGAVMLPLLAGRRPDGQMVVERVPALPDEGEAQQYRLLQGGMFVPGIASGDRIRLSSRQPGQFRVLQRSGHLCVRVMCREGVDAIEEQLLPPWERLGGWLEVKSPRALLLGIHVAVGFAEIEALLQRALPASAGWSYGNVYAADSGEPLGWWNEMLAP